MKKRILTCAVTGSGATVGKHPGIPVTPEQIADSAIGAAKAGAAVVHIHVRDPETGRGSMEMDYYRETVERIREGDVDVVINLTTGPGAWFFPGKKDPNVPGPGTNLCSAEKRVRHVLELKPEICTLDLNTMWFRDGVLINAPEVVGEMAKAVQTAGVLPEIEVFDTGDIQLARHLIDTGVLTSNALFQIVLGVKYGAIATPETMLYMRNLLPAGAPWTAFGASAASFTMLAQSLLLGGHVRIGLEDTLYLEKGVQAPDNAALVEKAVAIMRLLGIEPATAAEAREILGIGGR